MREKAIRFIDLKTIRFDKDNEDIIRIYRHELIELLEEFGEKIQNDDSYKDKLHIIVSMVCKILNVSEEEFHSEKRPLKIMMARKYYCYFAYKLKVTTMIKFSKYAGFTHSNASIHIKKIKSKLLKKSHKLPLLDNIEAEILNQFKEKGLSLK